MLNMLDKRKSDWYNVAITYYNAVQLDVAFSKFRFTIRPMAVAANTFKSSMSPGMFASVVMSLADAFYLGS